MQRTTAKVFGFLLLGLGIVGLIVGDGRLFNLINIDISLDIARLGLAALLLYAAYGARDEGFVRTSLIVFSVMYLGLALLGTISPDLFRLAPNQLTNFDKLYHLIGGIVAGVVAVQHERRAVGHA
ncbi:MAG: hypothetical protein JWL85_180 [Candidatus Saccharibacteria bacterium]|nr:hypothetical protein [Candidatus Saccharibacteria bacterium]